MTDNRTKEFTTIIDTLRESVISKFKKGVCFLSVQASSLPRRAVMDPFDGTDPRETLRRVSASLGCSLTSAEVAAFLDKHDKLRHLRENFLVPKIADLPPCKSKKWCINVLFGCQCSISEEPLSH